MARAIDADRLLKMMSHWKPYMDMDKVRKAVQNMPTLPPPNEWVSVEERLPRLRENVLVCAYWHEHWGVYIGWNNGHGWTVSCGIGQRNDVQVSHWMLLPAPPAKEG